MDIFNDFTVVVPLYKGDFRMTLVGFIHISGPFQNVKSSLES